MRPRAGMLFLAAVVGGGCGADDGEVIPRAFDLAPTVRTLTAPAGSPCETLLPQARSVRGGPAAFTLNHPGTDDTTVPCTGADDTLTCHAQAADSGDQFRWTIQVVADGTAASVALAYDGATTADCTGSIIAIIMRY